MYIIGIIRCNISIDLHSKIFKTKLISGLRFMDYSSALLLTLQLSRCTLTWT